MSLSLAGEAPAEGSDSGSPGEAGSEAEKGTRRNGRANATSDSGAGDGEVTGGARRRASFEDAFATELESTFGDLGPADLASGPAASGGPRRSSDSSGGARRSSGGSGSARRRPRSGGR